LLIWWAAQVLGPACSLFVVQEDLDRIIDEVPITVLIEGLGEP
jgi:hypothetical protein